MKKCNKCGEVLPLHMFGKNKRTKDNLKVWCKTCSKKYNKAYYEENKEKKKKTHKAYYEENKEEIKKKQKAYYEENKEEKKKRDKAYCEENKEEIRNKKKTYYKENKEEINENAKVYYRENKEERGEYQRRRVLKLPDSYIRKLLNNQGIDESLITPEIMEHKRATIKVTRIIKQKESKNI